MKIKIFIKNELAFDQVSIYFVGEDANGKRFLAKPMDLTFDEMRPGADHNPSIRVSGFEAHDILPALANALAESGWRAESSDAGELKATKVHLEDMRRLVFK